MSDDEKTVTASSLRAPPSVCSSSSSTSTSSQLLCVQASEIVGYIGRLKALFFPLTLTSTMQVQASLSLSPRMSSVKRMFITSRLTKIQQDLNAIIKHKFTADISSVTKDMKNINKSMKVEPLSDDAPGNTILEAELFIIACKIDLLICGLRTNKKKHISMIPYLKCLSRYFRILSNYTILS